MHPYVALHGPYTAKIHTLITLGIRHLTKSLIVIPKGLRLFSDDDNFGDQVERHRSIG
jgi:hypothetical protein